MTPAADAPPGINPDIIFRYQLILDEFKGNRGAQPQEVGRSNADCVDLGDSVLVFMGVQMWFRTAYQSAEGPGDRLAEGGNRVDATGEAMSWKR
jgi:hypothetical protein